MASDDVELVRYRKEDRQEVFAFLRTAYGRRWFVTLGDGDLETSF